MSRITDLKIIQEFANNSRRIFGLYWCNFKGTPHLFTRNGDIVKVLTHYFGDDRLDVINEDVKEELLQEIEKYKIQECI